MEAPGRSPVGRRTPNEVGGADVAGHDTRLLFAARSLRLFGYGLISVILVLYLVELGLPEWRIGLLVATSLVT